MATINSLSTLSTLTGHENVVIQNGDGNFKMAYKPILIHTKGLPEETTAAAAIDAALNDIRATYGDLEGYHVDAYIAMPNWPNGLLLQAEFMKAGTYIAIFGTMYSQRLGVFGFSRWDTIGGAAGSAKTSQLGNALA